MKNYFLQCGFLVLSLLSAGGHVSAQNYDADETKKLLAFLMQESAEEGVTNYQQLGITDIENIQWRNVYGLVWNSYSYLLERVNWSNKKLAGHMDFSDFQSLKYLYCSYNAIKSVNVNNVPELLKFDFYENELDAVDVSTNPKLNYIRLGYNQIKEVDVSNNPELSFFCCTNNLVETLDLSDKGKLKTVYCLGNLLTSLQVDNCVQLNELLCNMNNLTTLHLYNLPLLQTFSCVMNQLTTLDFYNCTSLEDLYCNNNELSELDVSSCKNLSVLNCSANQLTSLKIAACSNLTSLHCENNYLDSLIIPDTPSLSTLSCGTNHLTFQTLPPVTEYLTDYMYLPQRYVALKCPYNHVDLSSFYLIDEQISKYTWYYKYTTTTPEESHEGVFVFDESYVGETFICRVQNEAFPRLVMHYDVTFMASDVGNEKIKDDTPVVYGGDGYIRLFTAVPAEVRVYAMHGALVSIRKIGEGTTDLPLESGMYVVVLNNQAGQKVIVR